MNIGVFSDCYLPTRNGVSTVIAQACAELVRRGHRVSVFTVTVPGDAEPGDACGQVYRFPSLPFNHEIQLRIGLAWQGSVNRLVERDELDIIHTHTEFTLGRAGQVAARAAGRPILHTLHTLYPAYRHYLPFGRFVPERAVGSFVERFLRGCDRVICPSEKGRVYVAACAPRACVTVIPNGIMPGRFCPGGSVRDGRSKSRAALGLGADARVVLYAGRLAPEKRVVDLLHALHPLLAADPSCRAVFVGAGPQREELESAANATGVLGQVLLTGPVPWHDMPQFYALADVFATASLSEIHPMTVIEAVSCGLPVVARRDPSMRHTVLDGCNGFLVDSDADIAGRLTGLLCDDAAREMFGRNAAALASYLTVATHVDRLEALYRHSIETHPRKGIQ